MATVEENILHSIKKNGYPEKKVALPFQPIFKACKSQGRSLTEVLAELEKKDIKNNVEGDRIVFFDKNYVEPPIEEDLDEAVKSFDPSGKIVKEAMKKMKDMDPNELEKIKQYVSNLTKEEKDNLLKQAKSFFKK